MSQLVRLAADPNGKGRGDIYLAIASLYRTQAPQLSERERALMRDILQRLTHDVEMAIRIALAERLADDAEAPLDLIFLLVDDRIEVARPIILRSRKLTDRDILKFLADADTAHQTACAERPNIGEPVTDILAKSEAESVLVALVRNATAKIGPIAFETLVEKSRRLAAIQEPLAKREDLPAPLATQMCAWVSDALKAHIAQRLPADVAAAALGRAVNSVQTPAGADAPDSARKLIDKLAAAGQLRAGFLLRVLHQGQIDLFDVAFARMLEIDLPAFRAAFYRNGPKSVALACRAVGIDRCVFTTVFNLSRQARSVQPAITNDERIDVEGIFTGFTKPEALARFARTQAA